MTIKFALISLLSTMFIGCVTSTVAPLGWGASAYSCDKTACQAIWSREPGEPEKSLVCDQNNCVCRREMVLDMCEHRLSEVSVEALVDVWEKGCCR